MANSSIYEKIKSIGELEANTILEIGKAKAKEYYETKVNEAKAEIETLTSKYMDKNEDRKKTKLTQIEQAEKQKSLSLKKDLINDVFKEAKQKLIKMDDAKLTSFVIKLLKNETLKGDEYLQVSKNDYSRYFKLFSSGKVEASYGILDKLGLPKAIKLSQTPASIDGGFIIVGKEYDVNYSYDTILEAIKEDDETQIANMLFGGE